MSTTSLALLMLLMTGLQPVAARSDRSALVIACQDYTRLNSSAITLKHAERIASALTQQGFQVTTLNNPTDAVARAGLRELAHNAEGSEVAMVVLAGHGVSYDGRTYFLPANAEITRPTDLLSRALAIPSIAQIAGRARTGAVFFLMTVADIPSTVQGIAARPSTAVEPDSNVVIVYSTSDKVPVSGVDRVSEQAALDFASAAAEKQLRLPMLVNAAQAGGVGKVVGKVADISLLAAPAPAPAGPVDADARLRKAEERARDAEARARQAEEAARQEAQRAENANAAMKAAAAHPQPGDETGQLSRPDETNALQLVEQLFGREQRKHIQGKLRRLGFYRGPIDSIFGDLTRQAIKDYQASVQQSPTGFLSPEQVQALLQDR